MDEQFLLIQLKQGDKRSFSLLFGFYYKDLVLFAGNFLPDRPCCEDIVQSVFLKLWNDRSGLVIESSLKWYLLQSVRNSCFDEIRHKRVKYEYESYMISNGLFQDMNTENYVLYFDLYNHMEKALEKIPEVYREAFRLNRFKGLKYREIAEKLKVSERTIEVRISKTIELLKKYMKEFLILFFC